MSASMTKKELANLAGYTYRRLYDIDRDLPEEKKLFVESEGGKYDLALFVQRWVEYNVSREVCDDDDLDRVKAQHELVKKEKTELEVRRMKGELVEVQDVRRLWGSVIESTKKNLLNLPNQIAPMMLMLNNVEMISGIIDAEIRKALEQMAQTPLPDYAASDDAEGDYE